MYTFREQLGEATGDFDALDNRSRSRSSSNPVSEDEELQAQIIVFYPNKTPIAYPLHAGVNIIGRRSSVPERDQIRMKEWIEEFYGHTVHGVFLESSSVSSAHAAIYLEPWGDLCFVKDLKSRNKTFLKQNGHHRAVEPFVKSPMQSGGSLTFGALRCRISFGASFEGVPSLPAAAANVTRSPAVSINQLPSGLTDNTGSTSLDKCPSLQEWFCHPSGASPSNRQSPPGEPEPGVRLGLGKLASLTHRHSFGFNPVFSEQDDHTSSDAEPETPRIDRPQAVSRTRTLKPASQSPWLEPMLEDDKEGQDSDGMQDHSDHPQVNADVRNVAEASQEQELEEGNPVSIATDLSTSSAIPFQEQNHGIWASSPTNSFTEEEMDQQMSPRGPFRQQHSPLKRSRSGRQHSERPRSKSPRLQRGFAVREPSFRLEEMREAVSNIRTDA